VQVFAMAYAGLSECGPGHEPSIDRRAFHALAALDLDTGERHEKGPLRQRPSLLADLRDAGQLRSAFGCGVEAVSVDMTGAGVAATGASATGAAAGGLFQVVDWVVVVVLDESVAALVTGALTTGSALRLPSRFNGAPGGVP
jgi:hypothetical protein